MCKGRVVDSQEISSSEPLADKETETLSWQQEGLLNTELRRDACKASCLPANRDTGFRATILSLFMEKDLFLFQEIIEFSLKHFGLKLKSFLFSLKLSNFLL